MSSNEKGYRFSHLGKGEDYDQIFFKMTEPQLHWIIEQKILMKFLEPRTLNDKKYLDVACGTGRILDLINPYFMSSLGVDVSESMLKIAKEKVQKSTGSIEFIQGDITRELKLPANSFDFITIFRFFPNAEESLRRDMAGEVGKLIGPSGVIVVNNHKNRHSFKAEILRCFLGRDNKGMAHDDVVELFPPSEFELILSKGIGLIPQRNVEKKVSRILFELEWIFTKLGIFKLRSSNVVYFFRKRR